jgi:pimeloyl-ACP methyl ester carboxylesterase
VIGSPDYPETLEEVQERAGETWDRGISASGVARQMVAILAQPDRSRRLRDLTMPTLVIHGLADKMVHVSGGRATSHAIPGSELLLVPGMGHDVPEQLRETFADAIARNAARAR